jgi:outer membrane protein assembly factor BamE (lipoprotein component of BamABCDE complex)
MGLSRVLCMALILGSLLAAGCSTPESRIRKNQAVFDAFPPDVQENVRAGTIRLGYTQPMVAIALGRPDRVYTRTTEATNSQVWAYSAYRRHSHYEPVFTPDSYVDANGRVRHVRHSAWVDMGWDEQYDILRIEFNDQGVSAIESLRP